MRPRILLDVDGPLTPDFFEAFCRELRRQGIDATPDKITEYDIGRSFGISPKLNRHVYKQLQRPGVASSFKPALGALELVFGLRQWADVYAVTAPLDGSPTWSFEREEWLMDKFNFARSEIVHARDKRLIAGDAFVDDKLVHLVDWSKEYPQKLAIMWSEAHNSREPWTGARANNYKELYDILETLREK